MIERTFSGDKPRTALPAGAIDTQTHLFLPGFPAQPGGPDLPEGLPGPGEYRQVMDWLGIERVVITQGNAHQFDNANMLACLADMGDAARGVAVITGKTTDAEMARLHAAGVRGARIMDLPGGATGFGYLEEVDARATAAGWMMAVQFDGNMIGEHEPRLARLKARYVIDHHGKFFAGASPEGPEVAVVKRLIDRGNCWFKFAGCYESSRIGGPDFDDIAAISRTIAIHAPERIIWGTNWPHNLARTTADYPNDAGLVDTVLGWLDGDRALRLAVVDNPEELFGF
jgi:D-galactarolactone isomerase